MTGDIPAAALRLMSALPVRTHERRTFVGVQGSKNVRPIVIDGRGYASIKEVKRRLRVCSKTVTNWLNSGRAVRG